MNTTHDRAAAVDHEHLAQIRKQPTRYAPGGVEHLILEVLSHAADEAEAVGRAGRGIVTLHADGSVSVADDGRGTETRVDAAGRVIKKPVMGTKDLRFFEDPMLRRCRTAAPAAGCPSWPPSAPADLHQPAHRRVMDPAIQARRAHN